MERIITRILLILFFSITFLLSSIINQVEALSKKIPYSTKSQTAQILHQLENIYINAVVTDNNVAIQKSLKNIIRCQKLLEINSKSYEKELNSFSKNNPNTIKYTNTLAKVVKKPQNSPLSIKSITNKNNTIIIKFNRPITKQNMLFFELNNNGVYKDIYDIKAKLKFNAPNISLKNVNKIKIAQNRLNKVRIVLENKRKIYSSAYIRRGTLFIEVIKNPNKTVKTKYKPKPVATISKRSKNKKFASSKIIVIDPGHGGKDSGAVGYKKYKEKDSVLKISKLINKLLKKKGYKVYMTRDSDEFIELHKRTKFANNKNADLFISIHANASPSSQKLTLKGLETFFLSPAKSGRAKRVAAKENSLSVTKMNNMSKNTLLSFLNKNKIVQSNKLAIDIQRGMLTQVSKKYKGIRDGGVREAPFWVLVGAQMPAVLVETGYITNPTEADRLFNPFYQKALAKGIAEGIDNYFVNN